MNPLAIVIFSKDRACQLDSLLRSLNDRLIGSNRPVFVLFKATTDRFKEGYARLKGKKILDGMVWVEEKKFRTDFLDLLNALNNDFMVMFLVDDIVFHRRIQIEELLPFFGKRHLFISLRCSRNYKADRQPRFLRTGNFLEWRWTFRSSPRGVWNYPFSLDGNIYRKKLIADACARLDFKGPNSLERELHSLRWNLFVRWRNKAIAPTEAVLFNNPLNLVQTEGKNWHQNISATDLNEKYLAGFCIDNSPLYLTRPEAVHYAVRADLLKDNVCL
jgi:hypothetical protein